MSNKLKSILCASFAAVTLIGCQSEEERAQQLQKKLDRVEKIADNSLQNCDLQKELPQIVRYEERLKEALMRASFENLGKIMIADLTICLDHRLDDFPKNELPQAVFYPGKKPVLSLKSSMTGATESSGKEINSFFRKHSPHKMKDTLQGGNKYSYTAAFSTGKASGILWYWGDTSRHKAFADNPSLNFAPLRK